MAIDLAKRVDVGDVTKVTQDVCRFGQMSILVALAVLMGVWACLPVLVAARAMPFFFGELSISVGAAILLSAMVSILFLKMDCLSLGAALTSCCYLALSVNVMVVVLCATMGSAEFSELLGAFPLLVVTSFLKKVK